MQIIADALNQLSPQRANLVLLSAANEGQCHLKEKWFGTQYSMEGKTAAELRMSDSCIRGGERVTTQNTSGEMNLQCLIELTISVCATQTCSLFAASGFPLLQLLWQAEVPVSCPGLPVRARAAVELRVWGELVTEAD